MKAVRRNNATGNFSWIGSDGWSARDMVSDTNEAEVEGCLSVQPQANPVNGFEEYFLGLNVENNKRNPWFTGMAIKYLCSHIFKHIIFEVMHVNILSYLIMFLFFLFFNGYSLIFFNSQ